MHGPRRATPNAGRTSGEADARDPAPLWRTVRELALKTLTETTKDLEVAAWLTEALVRSHGLAGLTAGAQVMAGLAERYWDGLFPLPDDYGMETRVSPVTGLNGRDGNGSLMQPLYMTGAVQPAGRHAGRLLPVPADRNSSARSMRNGASAHRGGAIPFEDSSARRAPQAAPVRAHCCRDARAARDAWQAMADMIDAKAGADGPSTTAVRDLLSGIIEIARRYAPAEAAAAGDRRPTLSARLVATASRRRQSRPRRGCAPGQIASREDALRALGEIANFFRRTEPHSPLSYTLDEAVRRGRMTWPELLAEVVADTDTRNSDPEHARHPTAAARGVGMSHRQVMTGVCEEGHRLKELLTVLVSPV